MLICRIYTLPLCHTIIKLLYYPRFLFNICKKTNESCLCSYQIYFKHCGVAIESLIIKISWVTYFFLCCGLSNRQLPICRSPPHPTNKQRHPSWADALIFYKTVFSTEVPEIYFPFIFISTTMCAVWRCTSCCFAEAHFSTSSTVSGFSAEK